MVASTSNTSLQKREEKLPSSSKRKATLKGLNSNTSLEKDVAELKADNEFLKKTLTLIHNTATDQMNFSRDLVWFAHNRIRYPNHKDSKRIEQSEEHNQELQNLKGKDGDFYHGMNSGILASSRLFFQIANITKPTVVSSCVRKTESNEDVLNKYQNQVEGFKKKFPDLHID